MKIIAQTKKNEIATVFIAKNDRGNLIEFVESTQPPFSIKKKIVLIISTLYGCPVKCSFCDANVTYKGILTKEDLLFQIDYIIKKRFKNNNIDSEKFKIQFSRMGEPSLNPNVLTVLEELPQLYYIPGLLPSLSTVAPVGSSEFFNRLLIIKKDLYKKSFQLQFSIHTTCQIQRNELIPIKKWNFEEISEYGDKFYDKDGKKITLNFALAKGNKIDPEILLKYFSPEKFVIKITPVNPTFNAKKNKIQSLITDKNTEYSIVNTLIQNGYQVILSIGELSENLIGSNCGQHIINYLNSKKKLSNSYTYKLEKV